MTKCYLPNCENETEDSSGLCEACRQRSWLDHVRTHAGEIPAGCVEHWEHRPDQYWYWSTQGIWRLVDSDPRVLPDFGGFERPAAPAQSAPPAPDDLAAIIAAQHAEIAQLKADKVLLEQIIAQERSATGRLLCQN